MLQEVHSQGAFDIKFHLRDSGGTTNRPAKEIELPLKIIDKLEGVALDGVAREAKAIGLLFHETTHAYLALCLEKKDQKITTVYDSAKRHYAKTGKLTDGRPIPDADLATTEAAGWYVHERIYYWWLVRELSGTIDVATILRLGMIQQKLAKRNFGKVRLPNDEYGTIATEMHPGLQRLCDTELLEGKIPGNLQAILSQTNSRKPTRPR